jgi:hypothetical protein
MTARRTNAKSTAVAVGFRAHTGWAAAVTITIAAGVPVVVDRRRVSLHDPAMPLEMYHVAGTRSASEAKDIIARATRAINSTAKRALKDLCDELRADGHGVSAAGVVLGSGRLVLPLASALRSHAGSHAAEGELYRQSLVRASEALGLRLTAIPEPILYEHASAMLKMSPERIRTLVADLGKPLGPPWTQDQKSAALVAWLSLLPQRARRTEA